MAPAPIVSPPSLVHRPGWGRCRRGVGRDTRAPIRLAEMIIIWRRRAILAPIPLRGPLPLGALWRLIPRVFVYKTSR
jgi:hypothetical protein